MRPSALQVTEISKQEKTAYKKHGVDALYCAVQCYSKVKQRHVMHVQSSKHEYLNTYGKFTFPLSQRAKFLKCFLIKERAKNILEDK